MLYKYWFFNADTIAAAIRKKNIDKAKIYKKNKNNEKFSYA